MKRLPFQLLLERYKPLAHDSMAILAKEPEAVCGKPWDFAHYIRVFRIEEECIVLEVDTISERISGTVYGVTGARAHKHPWGTALVLEGPLRWVGTRTIKATGLTKMVAQVLPNLGSDRVVDYSAEWSQLTLVLPCAWHP